MLHENCQVRNPPYWSKGGRAEMQLAPCRKQMAMPSVIIKKALPLLCGRQGGKWMGARVYWSAARAFSMRCMASLMASRAVAKEKRMKASAPKARPGTVATRASSRK